MVDLTNDVLQPTERIFKVADFEDAPHWKVSEEEVSIESSPTNGFISNRKSGNTIKGPLSIGATPQKIRVAGMWRMNPLLLSGFPSTTVTPIPVLYFDIPAGKFVQRTSKDLMTLSMLFTGG